MQKSLLKIFSLLLLFACALPIKAQQKYVGGDVSLLKAYEDKNAPYYDSIGTNITPLLPYLKNTCGMNAMRVRLFHTPANASTTAKGEGVLQDLSYVKALGKEIKDAGLSFMLDFHYSDTWADPSNQWTPKAWLNLTDADLQDSIYNYTKYCLTELVNNGATPDFIQIGNEISYGMCWGEENSSSAKKYYAGQSTNRSRFTNLLTYASRACREVCPQAKIIIHTERVANPSYIVSFYKDMDDANVDYDIIGTSYYSYYHGFLPQLETALKQIEQNFTKDIWVVEMGYYHAWQPSTVDYDYSSNYDSNGQGHFAINGEGQKAYTQALIALLNNHPQVKGLFWWEMDANDGEGSAWDNQHVLTEWYNAGLVDNATSKLLPATYVMKDFLNSTTGISSLKKDNTVTDDKYYNLNGQRISKPQHGVYIHQGKKTVKR